ncbi:hypothetical protein [Antrihabitans cavernicola]|uniref:Uncharacterized protein n=1 Tax=Antrihabitans cavernicola TaxID=2495913 RepID=A0A5A7S8Y9_9NOCA|nr:hypothetical protein [Spelaeibacter cavernicola]KAA0021103.1 hypothetical protein FOY51_21030 [Spelaeibacter cavernicola]
MSTDPQALADQLLEAQVQFVLAEFTGDRCAEVVARDVAAALKVADTLILADVVDRENVKATARKGVDDIGGSTIVKDMTAAIADGIYDLAASDDYKLKDVVDRDVVDKLITQFLSMHTLHDRALDRLTESPLVAAAVSRYVNKIVADFLDENRQRAEKLPGMGSLISLGTSAAKKARSVSEPFVGDVAGKSAQFALKRSNSATRDLLQNASLHDAGMELWDVHAGEPVAELRKYLSQDELSKTALLVHELSTTGRNTEYFGQVLDESIDVFFDLYGSYSLAALLPEVGISEDDIVREINRYAPALIEGAKKDGVLADLVRERLEPFFKSDAVTSILAGVSKA